MAVPTIGLIIYKAVRDEKGKAFDLYVEYANGGAVTALGVELTGTMICRSSSNELGKYSEKLRKAFDDNKSAHFIAAFGPAGSERWFRSTVVPLDHDRLLHTLEDITGIKEAEQELLSLKVEMIAHEHTQNQFFLLELADALRPLSDPVEIQQLAMEMLAVHLGVMRTFYYLIADDQETCMPWCGYERGGEVHLPKILKLSDYGADVSALYRAGCTLVWNDVESDPKNASKLDAFRALRMCAGVGVPLVKDGKFVAALAVHHDAPRAWTNAEVKLMEEVAERTWASVQYAAAEMALRASEQKFRTLVYSMNEGYVLAEMIYDDNGKVIDYLHIEVNDAVERLTGVKVLAGMRISEVAQVEDAWYEMYARVVATGEPERLERYSESLNMSFSVYATRVGGAGSKLIAFIFDDITGRSGRP